MSACTKCGYPAGNHPFRHPFAPVMAEGPKPEATCKTCGGPVAAGQPHNHPPVADSAPPPAPESPHVPLELHPSARVPSDEMKREIFLLRVENEATRAALEREIAKSASLMYCGEPASGLLSLVHLYGGVSGLVEEFARRGAEVERLKTQLAAKGAS